MNTLCWRGKEVAVAARRTELTHKSYVIQNDILFPACLPAESEPIFRFILYMFSTTTAAANYIVPFFIENTPYF